MRDVSGPEPRGRGRAGGFSVNLNSHRLAFSDRGQKEGQDSKADLEDGSTGPHPVTVMFSQKAADVSHQTGSVPSQMFEQSVRPVEPSATWEHFSPVGVISQK